MVQVVQYLLYPEMEETNQFPPEIRQALADSPEFVKAFGVGGFTMGPDLVASDLDLVIEAGSYRQTGSTNATLARHYPVEGQSGNLQVFVRIPALSIEQRYVTTSGRVEYRRWMNSGVWGPWYTYAATRVSQTAGRAIYQWDDVNNREQLIYGDTGVRDIRALFDPAKCVVGTAKIRRVGHVIEMRLLGIQAISGNAHPSGSLLVGSIPYGFRNEHTVGGQATQGSDQMTRASLAFNGSSFVVDALPVNPSTSVTLIWTTLDAWPTTLPGDPVGSLPSA